MIWKKKLSIYTHDLKFFYQITHLLKKEEIAFKAMDNFQDFTRVTTLILTTPEDFNDYKPNLPPTIYVLKISPDIYNLEETLILICQNLFGIREVNSLSIAIDPGEEKTGVAIFLNDRVVYTREIRVLGQLGSFIKDLYHLYPNADRALKIGEGNFFLSVKYLDYLKQNHLVNKDVEIQLVDEYRTSKSQSFEKNKFSEFLKNTKTIHEKSAILIGQRRGKKFFLSDDED